MKRVTNKELTSVILVNIGLLAAAVYMWLIYDRRQTIIKSAMSVMYIRVIGPSYRFFIESLPIGHYSNKVSLDVSICARFTKKQNIDIFSPSFLSGLFFCNI